MGTRRRLWPKQPGDRQNENGNLFKTLIAAGVAGFGLAAQPSQAQEPVVIELTQTPCQFLESENGVDRGFSTTRKADCESINAATGSERLAKAKVLDLKPGTYIFRVSNKNVPYPLGSWLRRPQPA